MMLHPMSGGKERQAWTPDRDELCRADSNLLGNLGRWITIIPADEVGYQGASVEPAASVLVHFASTTARQSKGCSCSVGITLHDLPINGPRVPFDLI